MTLYEIDKAILIAAEIALDPDTGEINDEAMMATLDQLRMEREKKCENIACWIKDLAADANAIREEEKALADRRRSIENKAEHLKGYLRYALQGEKLSTARCSVSYRRSTQVDVDLEALEYIRDDLLRFREPEPDKKAIKAALESGEEIPGCKLVENISMIIK